MTNQTIDPGTFRHRLSLENQIETPDGCGGFTTSWQLVSDVWAAVKPMSGAQYSTTGTLNARTTHKITIRWRSDCKPEMRFVKSGRGFLINTVVDPDETKRYLDCICEETI